MILDSFREVPTASNAFFDRTVCSLKTMELAFDEPDNLGRFCSHLGRVSRITDRATQLNCSYFGPEGIIAPHGFLFNAMNRNESRAYEKMKISPRGRGAGVGRAGYPIMGGDMSIKISSLEAGCRPLAHLDANLRLNFSRYAFHNIRRRRLSCQEERILTSSRTPNFSDEVSLTGNDNLIMGFQRRYLKSEGTRRGMIGRYWSDVCESLDSEVSRSLSLSQGSSDRIERVSGFSRVHVHKAEVYWEVRSERSITDVGRIRAAIEGITREAAVESYPTLVEEVRVKAPVLKKRLTRGIEFKAYAKTNKAIRLELTYNLAKSELTKTAPLDSITTVLDRVAEDGASRMAVIFRHIQDHLDGCEQASSLGLLSMRLYDAIDNPEHASLVLDLLTSHGALSNQLPQALGHQNFDIRAIIKRLRAVGVLERGPINRAGQYVLAAPYRHLARRYSGCVAPMAENLAG